MKRNLGFNTKASKFGFTLVELLVVISIIGILAALATASFSTSQKQARDTQRKSDLKQYQTALEEYANRSGGLYPAWSNVAEQITTGSRFCDGLDIESCPEDARYDTDPAVYSYYYRSNGGESSGDSLATKYILWARIERDSGYYWVVCSTGQAGKTASNPNNASGDCPGSLEQ